MSLPKMNQRKRVQLDPRVLELSRKDFPVAVDDSLFEKEPQNLEEAETIIEKGQRVFVAVGRALAKIRDEGWYKESHETFEEYCRQKWDISRPRAYQLIGAVEVVDNLSTGGRHAPETEKQIRPLTKLKPEQQRVAWEKVIEETEGGRITEKAVSTIVDKLFSVDDLKEERSLTHAQRIAKIRAALNAQGKQKFDDQLSRFLAKYEAEIIGN